MAIEHLTPCAPLEALRVALTQLRALAAQPSADPFYAQAAEQVAGIVAGLESRKAPSADSSSAGVPGQAQASATGGMDPVPPNPG